MNPAMISRIAVGATSLFLLVCAGKAQYQAPGTERQGKPFTVSLDLREEYDDNINTRSSNEEGSFKTIVRPSIIFNYPMDQTIFSARYSFGATYYQERPGEDWDTSHEFTGRIAHTFSPRFDLDFRDRFSYSDQPELNQGSTVFRNQGNRYNNAASMELKYQWTERFSTVATGTTEYIHYEDEDVADINDYIRNSGAIDFRFLVFDPTTAVLNYTYTTTDYDEIERDFDSHYAVAGVDHYLLREWLLSVRGGAEFTTYEGSLFDDAVGPYASVNTVWNYTEKSTLQAGYSHSRQLTDFASAANGLTHQFDLSVTHYFTPKLSVRNGFTALLVEYTEDQSLVGDQDETILTNDFSIRYDFNEYFSTYIGYKHTTDDSDIIGREYYRNQWYIGFRGTY
jgi:hypothetical protein